MAEPLPCPFCGHVGLSHREGSTFRWLSTECNGCGAQCGEERINTMTMERSAAVEQAKEAAIKTWNTRVALLPPQQQAEPMTEVADRFAHRMALELECVLSDGAYSNKWYTSAMQVLSEYRSAMNEIHEQHSPTFMGEPKL